MGAFSDLLLQPETERKVARAFERVIARSFEQDRSRPTRSEVRRRFAICERWFRDLRRAYTWSIDRVLSNLGPALRHELDGVPFRVNTRPLWTPDREVLR